MGAFKMEWKIGEEMWVGGYSPFSVDNDLLTAQDFELPLQKKEETLSIHLKKI